MLPALDDVLAGVHVVSLPLVTRFRGITVREAALIEGPAGWTEFSPFLEYDDAESATWLAAALEYGWTVPPTAQRDRIPVNATVPAVTAAEVPGVLARFDGVSTAKVKVAERGGTLAEDVARVAAVRAALGDDAAVRIDANAGWSLDEAERALIALAPYRLEYAEQPCASVEDLATLRARLDGAGVLIAADESVRKADDPLRVARAGAADLLVVKAQPLGGIQRALDIVAEAGLPVVVSSALDTSVGLAMGARLAAALPALPYACGLGTASLLAADVTAHPLRAQGGSIGIDRIDVDRDLLDRSTAAPERRTHWRERIRRCHAVLAARTPGR